MEKWKIKKITTLDDFQVYFLWWSVDGIETAMLTGSFMGALSWLGDNLIKNHSTWEYYTELIEYIGEKNAVQKSFYMTEIEWDDIWFKEE